jgi:hypothetical protein
MVGPRPPGRPYPLLALIGEQGVGKSDGAKRLIDLFDPGDPPLRSQPRTEYDLVIAARSRLVVGFDHLSPIEEWLSDALCGLATGAGLGTRALYQIDAGVLFNARRPVLITSIADAIQQADLLDRTITIHPPAIADDQRLLDAEAAVGFEAVRPALLGASLTRLMGTLREEPATRLTRLPRMADFGRTAVAAERGAREPPIVLAAYQAQGDDRAGRALDASVLGAEIVRFVDRQPEERWSGTMAELLDALVATAETGQTRRAGWPQTPRALSPALRRIAPAMRRSGITVDLDIRAGHDRRRLASLQRLPAPPPPEPFGTWSSPGSVDT